MQLPEGWTSVSAVDDVIVADGLSIRRSGIAATSPRGEEVTGAAADLDAEPGDRSRYELLERIAVIEAMNDPRRVVDLQDDKGSRVDAVTMGTAFPQSHSPEIWRFARSNGIALHADFAAAARRAKQELVERDRVLRSWLGEITPERLPLQAEGSALATTKSYEWDAYRFPADVEDLDPDAYVIGVFGFPVLPDAPLVIGYAARETYVDAYNSAVREAVQQLAFLWGEALPVRAPEAGPTAAHHLEHFQYQPHHELLRKWLAGAHSQLPRRARAARASSHVRFIDLTPEWLHAFRVVKAMAPEALPLVFGPSPVTNHLPRELAIHPIA